MTRILINLKSHSARRMRSTTKVSGSTPSHLLRLLPPRPMLATIPVARRTSCVSSSGRTTSLLAAPLPTCTRIFPLTVSTGKRLGGKSSSRVSRLSTKHTAQRLDDSRTTHLSLVAGRALRTASSISAPTQRLVSQARNSTRRTSSTKCISRRRAMPSSPRCSIPS